VVLKVPSNSSDSTVLLVYCSVLCGIFSLAALKISFFPVKECCFCSVFETKRTERLAGEFKNHLQVSVALRHDLVTGLSLYANLMIRLDEVEDLFQSR